MRISDWSSDVCSSDLSPGAHCAPPSPASQERGFTDDQEETMERIEHRASFGGWQDVYRHRSEVLGCDMTVGVYFRSEERRVGKEGVSTCRSRWSAYP